MRKIRAVLLEDNDDFVRSFRRAFGERIDLIACNTIAATKEQIGPETELLLVDMFLEADRSGDPSGLRLIAWARAAWPDLPVVVISGHSDLNLVVQAMRLGAYDYLEKEKLTLQELRLRLENAVRHQQLSRRVAELEKRLEVYEPKHLMGSSAGMEAVRRAIDAVTADGSVTVLIRGETGTGKELVAKLIHAGPMRCEGPFVAVDLSSLPREMLAGEIFGHEKGAFTGANSARIGHAESANGGVLFLDEIAELPRDTQSHLFRLIEGRAVVRLGSSRPRPIDVQLVAATNQDLEQLVAAGEFRPELYYRLRVFEIRLPPLRERIDDLPELTELFLNLWHKVGRTPLQSVQPDAYALMQRYAWPGNIRELRNVLEAASVRARMENTTELTPALLSAEIVAGGAPSGHGGVLSTWDVAYARARAELECAENALRSLALQKEEARKILGYRDRHTMRRRLLGLRRAYPELWGHHPSLQEAYGRGLESAAARERRNRELQS